MPSTTSRDARVSGQSADLLCWLRMVGRDDRSWILAARGRKTGPSLEMALKRRYHRHVEVAGCETCHGNRRQLLFRHIDTVAAVGLRDANYLKRMSKKRARVPLVSEGLEPVEDDGDDGNPPFARAFLKALSNNTDVIDGSSPRFGAPSSCTQSKRPSIPTSVIQAMTAAIFCSCACHKAQQGRLDPLRKPPPRHLIS